MADDMTLQEAADALGVHYMTAYRYVRLGQLTAEKAGAVWRVTAEDLESFRSASAAPTRARGVRQAPWADRFASRLVAGDGRGSGGVVEAALTAGMDPADVYLEIISPALTQVGDRWAAGEIDVATEHRASGIAMRVLGRLGPRFARRGRTRGGVVVGTPAGEQHSLPVAMLADLLRSGGWEVSDVGCDVPPVDFARMATQVERLVAVGVSITNSACLDAAAHTVEVLRANLGDVPILVGGRAVGSRSEALALGADGWASDGRAALGMLDNLAAGRALDDNGAPPAAGNLAG
jgi:excisionase family DNA binding protein